MVCITEENLEIVNLSERERLELHLLYQAAVVIPSRMTVMEVIRVTEVLQGLASELLSAIGTACERCDECQMDEPCMLMTGPIEPEISVPGYALAGAGLDVDCKLTCQVEQGSGEIRVTKADYRFDLTDLRPDLLEMFRECGVYMNDLEETPIQEAIVYGDS